LSVSWHISYRDAGRPGEARYSFQTKGPQPARRGTEKEVRGQGTGAAQWAQAREERGWEGDKGFV